MLRVALYYSACVKAHRDRQCSAQCTRMFVISSVESKGVNVECAHFTQKGERKKLTERNNG